MSDTMNELEATCKSTLRFFGEDSCKAASITDLFSKLDIFLMAFAEADAQNKKFAADAEAREKKKQENDQKKPPEPKKPRPQTPKKPLVSLVNKTTNTQASPQLERKAPLSPKTSDLAQLMEELNKEVGAWCTVCEEFGHTAEQCNDEETW
eukprot:comp19972_c0_seq1/m.24358 comp19972_c0_seq1/g.24358  ORF comp19972_c0_seq1/g.24358 comp19972_c0_seq1/m.24358 type:complete len:151 (-) comp19972_c0_seq1:297-749(-)